MPHRRRILIGLVAAAAAVLVPVAPALAAPAAPTATSVAPATPVGDCQNPADPADGYAPPTRCELGIVRAEAVCLEDAPALAYAVEPVGTPNQTVTITWSNPDGTDLVESGLPLSGQVYWPGTVVVDGRVVDWPGWTQLPDGSWTEHDAYDYTRPQVEVTFTVNPSASTVVAYPPASAVCANPPRAAGVVYTSDVLAAPDDATAASAEVQAASAVLAATGTTSAPLLAAAGALLLVGGVLVAVPRRRRHRAR